MKRFVSGCLFLLFSVFCFLSSPLAAQETARKVTLTDGVRLLLMPDAATDTIAVTLFVRMEPDLTPDDAAIGELVSRAFLYGNENRSFESVVETVRGVSGDVEILRASDYVAVTFLTASSRLKDAAYLLGQALKNAALPQDALDRARKQILAERKQRDENGFQAALRAGRKAFRRVAEADEYALRRVRPAEAQAYFHAHYLPEHTVIALAGNFVPQQAQETFDNNFFDFDRRASAPFRPVSPRTIPNETQAKQAIAGHAAYALLVLPAPSVTSPDYPAFLVLYHLLGVGHASRLFGRIRDAQGLGYDVNALYQPGQPETWAAYLQWDAARGTPAPDAAAKQLSAVLDSVLTEPPTDTELNRARALAIGAYAARHEHAREVSLLLGWYETMGAGFAFDTELPKKLAAVSRNDVLRAARLLLAHRVTVLAVPAPAAPANR